MQQHLNTEAHRLKLPAHVTSQSPAASAPSTASPTAFSTNPSHAILHQPHPPEFLPSSPEIFYSALLRHNWLIWRTVPQSFSPRWIDLVRPPLLAYHAASQANDQSALLAALAHLLALPRLYLLKHSGRTRKAMFHLRQRLFSSPSLLTIPPKPSLPSDPVANRVSRAAALVADGFIGKATRSLSQSGVHDISQPIIDTLHSLHPRSSHDTPALPDTAPFVIFDPKLVSKLVFRRRSSDAAPGLSGWTESLILPLLAHKDLLDAFSTLLQDIAAGNLSEQARQLLLTSSLVPTRRATTAKGSDPLLSLKHLSNLPLYTS